MICPAASEKMLPLQLDGFPFYLYFEFFFLVWLFRKLNLFDRRYGLEVGTPPSQNKKVQIF